MEALDYQRMDAQLSACSLQPLPERKDAHAGLVPSVEELDVLLQSGQATRRHAEVEFEEDEEQEVRIPSRSC